MHRTRAGAPRAQGRPAGALSSTASFTLELPADRRARDRRRSSASRRCCAGSTRSAAPISPLRVHPARRGDRPDPPDRPLGAQPRLPQDAVRLQALSGSRSITMSVNLSGRQLPAPRDRGRGAARRCGRPRSRAVIARPRDHRERDDARTWSSRCGACTSSSSSACSSRSTTSAPATPRSTTSGASRSTSSRSTSRSSTASAANGEQTQLTRAIIGLAEILNLHPVAEGIEEPAQLERLRELQCRFGQGYLFAKPVGIADAEGMMADPHLGERHGERHGERPAA